MMFKRICPILSIIIISLAVLLAGCTCQRRSRRGLASAPAGDTPLAQKEKEHVVNLYIWANFTSATLLADFEKTTGIRVRESNFTSNEELLAKLQAGATGYDLIIPSDYMSAVMIKLGLLQPLNKDKIPNAANINPKLLSQEFDPPNVYTLPYGWGLSGIAINRRNFKGKVDSWQAFFELPELKRKTSLLDDAREAIGVALKYRGHSLNTTDDKKLADAKGDLLAAKKRIKEFNSTPINILLNGEVDVAHMYSNEALMAAKKTDGGVEFVFPAEGGCLNIDNFAVPVHAKHVEEAHSLINFLLEPKNNLEFVSRTFSGPVIASTVDRLPKELPFGTDVLRLERIFSRGEVMHDVGETAGTYERIWTEVKAAAD